MYRSKLIYSFLALALLAAGFLLSFWPLSLLSLLCAAATGQYTLAVIIGLVLDSAFGAPIGRLHFLYVPFTLLAFVTGVLRYYLSTYVRRKDSGLL